MNMLDAALERVRRDLQKPPPKAADHRRMQMLRIQRMAAKLAALKMEGLALFNPLPAAIPFLKSTAKWQLADGSNQAAKTMHAAYKVALILAGQDPMGIMPKGGGKGLIVGLDGDHIANPMWSKLAKEGAFSIIRDEHTGLWRSIRPDPNNPMVLDPYDLAYKEKWRDAPPLIPPRMIREIAWDNAGTQQPRLVKTTTGWEVLCRSSGGPEPQGIQIHFSWFDEELLRSQVWKTDVTARGIRHGAVNIWSATPLAGGMALYELRLRADSGSPDVEAFTFLIEDNPFMSPEEKAIFYETLSEDDKLVRYHGHYATAGRLAYGTYRPMGEHGCEPFEIPSDYCRELVLDPGSQFCGTLFGAIDPEEKHHYVYDGFVMRHADPYRWADRVKERSAGIRFERMICDQQMGQSQSVGLRVGESVSEQFWKALKERDILPRTRGPLNGFFRGSKDTKAREQSLLSWLRIRDTGPFPGTPLLQVFRGAFPELDNQIKLAHYDMKNPDKRAKLQEDALVCLEYWAASDPRYCRPMRDRTSIKRSPQAALDEFLERRAETSRQTPVALG